METKKTTYDISEGHTHPTVGSYLVGIGKRGILSVNLIKAIRIVNARVVRDFVRYELQIVPVPDLKEYTEYELVHYEDRPGWHTANVWVRGVEALPFFWHPRGKTK